MGSKTPGGEHEHGDAVDSKMPSTASSNKPNSSGLLLDDLGGNDDSDDDDDDHREDPAGMSTVSANADKKKKRKRSKKKKTKNSGAILTQSSPPRVLLASLFSSGIFPEGEIVEYNDSKTLRTSGEEHRYLTRLDHMDESFLKDYRQAAEVHRQVRKWTEDSVQPGHTLTEIALDIEDGVRALTGHQGLEPGDSLKAGMGFPTGLCLNNVAAHYTPNPGTKDVILQAQDVVKVDFGVHINGKIVDSAFTMAFDPTYDNLLASVKDATNTGVKLAGIDVRMSDIGGPVQEVMESYEVEIKGKVYPIKAVRSITGHDIKPYRIHGEKQVPFIKSNDHTKMEEGDVFAIETFGSTGRGYLRDDVGIYGYGLDPSFARSTNYPGSSVRAAPHLSSRTARSLLSTIDENFGSIVFCRRYLERLGVKHYLLGMKDLIANGIVQSYAPLSDTKGTYVAQFEHTILLRSSCKEVISRGQDY